MIIPSVDGAYGAFNESPATVVQIASSRRNAPMGAEVLIE
jgi:hypothetical protein